MLWLTSGSKKRCCLGSGDDAIAVELDAFCRLQDEMAVLSRSDLTAKAGQREHAQSDENNEDVAAGESSAGPTRIGRRSAIRHGGVPEHAAGNAETAFLLPGWSADPIRGWEYLLSPR